MNKKCSVTIGLSLFALYAIFINGLYDVANFNKLGRSHHGVAEIQHAVNFIHANEIPEFSGNNSSAIKFAEHLSVVLRNRGNKKMSSVNRVSTYCYLNNKNLIVFAHIAESECNASILQQMHESIWSDVNAYAEIKRPEVAKVAISLMSDRKILSIITGEIGKDTFEVYGNNLMSDDLKKLLLPFFAVN